MEYCILTPIGPQKRYARDLYWDAVDALHQQPTQIYLYSQKNVHSYWMRGEKRSNVTWCQEPEDMKTRTIIATTAARESLRQNFLEKDEAEWALLLDPDIIPCPDIIDKFEKFLEGRPLLAVLRAFHPSRVDSSEIRHGLSCTFAHRDALSAHPFTMAHLRGSYTGDDLVWMAVMSQLNRRGKVETLAGFYFDVKHAHEDGRVKEFSDEYKRKLIC